ncbi:MAG: hypothetical protein QM727_15710 [Niabella sp.]
MSTKLNGEDVPVTREVTSGNAQETTPRTENVEELKEISIGAITQSVKMLAHGNTVVSGLRFHTIYAPAAVEAVGFSSLVKDEDFIKQIKRNFKSIGVKYRDDLAVEIVYESKQLSALTPITSLTAVEVITPNTPQTAQRAQLRATEGITWEDAYILEPVHKQYFIGRCKSPKIENGPKIHNDIAFVGIEEKNEPQYEINNYVSRSHAYIVYDAALGVYKLFRSRFLNNPSHKLKIYNPGVDSFQEINLNQSLVPHVLKDGDNICFNDKVVLEFKLINE